MQGDKEEVCKETERRMGGEMRRRGAILAPFIHPFPSIAPLYEQGSVHPT